MTAGARRISAVLLDVSGTVLVDSVLLPGVREALTLLGHHQVPVHFLSNSSKESQARLVERLTSCGLHLNSDSVFTSLTAARDLGNYLTTPVL